MAFLFRGDKSHDTTLNKLCERLDIKTKHGALLWIVKNVEKLLAERDEFFQKTISQEKRIKTLESAIRNKFAADRVLLETLESDISPQNHRQQITPAPTTTETEMISFGRELS